MITVALPIPDDLTLLAQTIEMEAAGEPLKGKLAVGFNIVTRAALDNRSIHDTIYKPYAYSSWNSDALTRLNLDQIAPEIWRDCYAAACGAVFSEELGVTDPTGGAYFYMNLAQVMRVAGKLPSWWDIDGDPASTITIGKHTFRRKRTHG
jgi:spore germination cell wall hydrolase CwlJ-like protein